MKKPIIILTGLAAIVSIYFFSDFKYALKLFTIASAGNEPTLKVGTFHIGTNLKKPKILDFVFYLQELPGYPSGIWTQRLCGIENDTIQLIEGTLYLNGKNLDKDLNLNHQYKLDKFLASELFEDGQISKKDVLEIKNDTIFLNLSDHLAKQYPDKIKRTSRTLNNHKIVSTFGKPWNEENFGPIVVPKDSLFFLGDNRNSSYDSRFFGFVDKNKVKGVLINL